MKILTRQIVFNVDEVTFKHAKELAALHRKHLAMYIRDIVLKQLDKEKKECTKI